MHQNDDFTPEEYVDVLLDFMVTEFPEYFVSEPEEMFVLPDDMPEELFMKRLEEKFIDYLDTAMPPLMAEELYQEGMESAPMEELAQEMEETYEELPPDQRENVEQMVEEMTEEMSMFPPRGPHHGFGHHGRHHGGMRRGNSMGNGHGHGHGHGHGMGHRF